MLGPTLHINTLPPIDPIRHVVILLDPSVIEYAMPDGGYFLRGKKVETPIYLNLADCYESAYAKLVEERA